MDTEFIFISSQLPLNKLQLLKRDEILKTQDYFLFDKIDTFLIVYQIGFSVHLFMTIWNCIDIYIPNLYITM